MSHFSVVVCLDDEDGRFGKMAADVTGNGLRMLAEARLEQLMARWDENREVEPYRDYEEGGPAEHWLVRSVRSGADSHRQLQEKGAEALATERIGKHADLAADNISMAVEAVLEHASSWADAYAESEALGANPSWADVARLLGEKYGDEEKLLLSEDGSRAYVMSTRNPESKWDYWRIGGRWGGYFPYRNGSASTVIEPERGWDSPSNISPLHCDGGPKSALDLEALREERAAGARKLYAEYQEIAAKTPAALPWSAFRDNISEGSGYTIEQAREEYHAQPRVRALAASETFRWRDDVISEFPVSEKSYVDRERVSAVPGFATLTTDGTWMAPGDMGWFGMSSDGEDDRISYREAANAYIEALPDDAWLVVLDCHI